MSLISQRLSRVQERIASAARLAGRSPEEVRMIGVTKTHPAEYVRQAIAAGLFEFGENRVQEAEAKIGALADERSRLRWHLIGHLQSNKARRAAALFDVVQTVDTVALAHRLDRCVAEIRKPARKGFFQAMLAAGARPLDLPASRAPLPVLLQVNVSGEVSKEGFPLAGWEEHGAILDAFCADVEAILALPHLSVTGLMTIAPWGQDPEVARPTFRSVRRLRDALAARFPAAIWADLSMGMTDDFEVAIAEGATIVRIGRAIFGERVQ